MDEQYKNPFGFDEIEQIQKEISADLKPEIPVFPEEQAPALSAEDLSSPGQRIMGQAVTPPEHCGECPDNSFFKQVVKREAANMHKRRKRGLASLLTVTIFGGLFGGVGIGIGGQIAKEFFIPSPGQSGADSSAVSEFRYIQANALENTDKAPSSQNSGELNYADIIDVVEPSVVSVNCRLRANSKGIFDYAEDLPDSTGSGIIFDEDERKVFIVTNNHVISEMSAITVSVAGCVPVPAVVVGTNIDSDIAVISILKSDLIDAGIKEVVAASFGSSDEMRVGDFVIAIGNAMGEGNTATFGIVSATNKEINLVDRTLTVIQTDAAINPGNSGGPLINLKGQVIGINTVKLSNTSIEGMGYSITSDVAIPIIEQLREQVTKPFLGVSCTNVTEEIADIYDLPPFGVIVLEVIQNSSADTAGIKVNDIITSFNGNTVYTMDQLTEEIQGCKIGDEVVVKFIRNGQPMTVEVTLTERTA